MPSDCLLPLTYRVWKCLIQVHVYPAVLKLAPAPSFLQLLPAVVTGF